MRDRTGQVWELESGRLLMLVLGPPERLEGPFHDFATHPVVDLLSGRRSPLYERDDTPFEEWPSPPTRRVVA